MDNVVRMVGQGISHGEKYLKILSKNQDSQIMLFLIGLLVMHIISDFILSPREENKEFCRKERDIKLDKRNFLIHCGIYSTLMFNYCVLSSYIFFDLFTLDPQKLRNLIIVQFLFSFINILSHAFIDFLVLPVKRKLFGCDQYNNFLIALGVDQILHVSFLLYTSHIYTQYLLENFVNITSFCIPIT